MKSARIFFPVSGSTWRNRLAGNANARFGIFALSALCIGAGCLGAVCWKIWEAQGQLAQSRGALHAAQSARSQRRLPDREKAKPLLSAHQLAAWNEVARQLNTPWSSLLDTLEAATPREIGLVSIEPDARQGNIRLQVEAKTLDSLLSYAGSLRKTGAFDDVVLVKHELNDQDPARPLRLSLELRLTAQATSGPVTTPATPARPAALALPNAGTAP